MRVAAIVLAVIVVVVGAAVIILKSDVPRQIAQWQASAQLGRKVTIGDLDIHFLPKLRIVVKDLAVANMETGTTPNMVEIARTDATIDFWALLRGKLDVLLLTVDRPVIVAEKDKSGRGNWQFHANEPATQAAPNFPVRKLLVHQGEVTYRDPTQQIDVNVAIDSTQTGDSGVERLKLDGKGRYEGSDFKLSGVADTVLNLQNKDQPYTFELEASVGETKARIAGTLKEPLRAEGLAADLHLEAHDAYDLYQLTGVAIPPTPPYKLDGKLYRDGSVWRLDPFTGQVGQSDLRGNLTFDTGGERPKLSGDLTSNKLRFADFGGFVGAKVGDTGESGIQRVQRKSEQKQAEGKPTRPPPKTSSATAIPDTEIDFERLKAMDAAVKFRSTSIEMPIVPMKEVATEISLDNGLLRVKPLRFAIGDGKIDFNLTLNGRQKPAKIDAAMSATRVPLGEVLRSLERELQQYETSTGTIGGSAEIRGQGNSPKALLGSSNGHLGLAMENGRIGTLLTALIRLDVARALGIQVTGNKPIPVRCMIAQFEFIDGIMGSKTLVLDTTDSNITGEGSINFKTEQVNFRIVPHPKEFSPLSARAPINISGTLGNISVLPDPAVTGARAAIAALLGTVLTPLAVPLAFLDAGLGKDSDCAKFVNEVRARSEQQKNQGSRSGETGKPPAPAPAR